MSLEHIADAARWMAYIRSLESARPDALFRDPYSRELAGDLGESLARKIDGVDLIANSIAVRTVVLDRLLCQMIAKYQIDWVLNIGSGLDTRPWRLRLPEQLMWLDVDLPAPALHKARILGRQRTVCRYGTLVADILDPRDRAAVIAACSPAKRVLAVTEGLLVYLRPAQVDSLAQALHRSPACQWWLTDLVGPRALRALREVWAPKLPALKFQFGPRDSLGYFARLGWREDSFYSSYEEARRLKRAPRQGWLAWLTLKLGKDSFREEIRRLAGVAVLAREELALNARRA